MSGTDPENATSEPSDAQVLENVLAEVAGRTRLAPVAAAARALAAELGTTEPGAVVPPGEVPDVDVPQVTKPRIDQPLGDPAPGMPTPGTPAPGTPLGGSVPGVIDAELVDDSPLGGAGSGGVGEASGQFTDSGVPTWDGVRERIEHRSGTALGSEELDRGSQAGRTLDEQWNERQDAGRRKLDDIRRSMKDS